MNTHDETESEVEAAVTRASCWQDLEDYLYLLAQARRLKNAARRLTTSLTSESGCDCKPTCAKRRIKQGEWAAAVAIANELAEQYATLRDATQSIWDIARKKHLGSGDVDIWDSVSSPLKY